MTVPALSKGDNYYVDMMPVMPYASAAGVRAASQFLVAGQPKAATGASGRIGRQQFSKKDRG